MGRSDERAQEDNDRTALDFYREFRGMNISELANESGVSRQTVGMACHGDLKLGEKRLRMLAEALHVDPEDLDQDMDLSEVPEKIVNISAELRRFEDKIAVCKPRHIKAKMDNIIAYLDDHDEDVQNIMTYLLTAASPLGKIMAGHLVKKLHPYAYYYKGYKPEILVGYYAEDEEAGEYQAFVLFEDWVYDAFGMENPLLELELPKPDGTGTEIHKSLDFAIPFRYDRDDEEMDFDSQLLGQITDYLWEVEASEFSNTKLTDLFEELIDDMYSYARILEYTCKDYDPCLPYRMKTREGQYTQLLYKILQEEGNTDAAIRKAAQLFSEIRTLEDGEKMVFERYGLNGNM
ncbi:MAG: helix-turn-helix transcriptional regulator [Enterocloster asparagiformis]|nr:helix-turn-helix transcriptional regulator [Enterocloster asparagiformis]